MELLFVSCLHVESDLLDWSFLSSPTLEKEPEFYMWFLLFFVVVFLQRLKTKYKAADFKQIGDNLFTLEFLNPFRQKAKRQNLALYTGTWLCLNLSPFYNQALSFLKNLKNKTKRSTSLKPEHRAWLMLFMCCSLVNLFAQNNFLTQCFKFYRFLW